MCTRVTHWPNVLWKRLIEVSYTCRFFVFSMVSLTLVFLLVCYDTSLKPILLFQNPYQFPCCCQFTRATPLKTTDAFRKIRGVLKTGNRWQLSFSLKREQWLNENDELVKSDIFVIFGHGLPHQNDQQWQQYQIGI